MKRLPKMYEVFKLREADLDIDRFTRKFSDKPIGNPDPMGSKSRDVSKVGSQPSSIAKHLPKSKSFGAIDFKKMESKDKQVASEFKKMLDNQPESPWNDVSDFEFEDQQLDDPNSEISWMATVVGDDEPTFVYVEEGGFWELL